MPVLDGYETTVKIRDGDAGERYTGINIIAMTANAMAGDRAKCLRVGMNDYIAKPIDPDLLEACLKRYLGGIVTGQLPVVESPEGEPQVAESSADKPLVNKTSPEAAPQLRVADNGRSLSENSGEQAPQPPIWDREDLLKRVRNNESLLLTLVKQFILDMPRDMDLLGAAVVAEDWPRVASQGHTIKGIAGNMSAKRLQLLSASLEQAALQGVGAEVQGQWANFSEQYQQLYLCLEEYLQTQEHEPSVSEPPALLPAEGEALVEWIGQLRTKLEQGSYVELSDIENFTPHCQQGREKEALEKLSAQLSQFDTAGAVVSVIELGELLSADLKS